MAIFEAAGSVNRAVGDQLRGYRTSKNMTQKQVANLSGVDLSSVRRYERGKRGIPFDSLAAICAAMGTTPTEIIRRATEAEPTAFAGGIVVKHQPRSGRKLSVAPEDQQSKKPAAQPAQRRREPPRGSAASRG